ncbi:hypothetical protein GCM10025881_40150 [Pseudolysinimonas kribbensis]|uniref:Uncharacterized protein n=1 Tax=Pseudolysinimonas kribbensis TaxID=433641 RepID=A0ABQ6KGJ4_9MICO|nr:hypothetical protein [Pseudolysinimonas kribbensis]GMA97191.1 hypothetical protein GCM10025881_40150 [Pseudolysinimonas kribbensis]
MRRTVALIAAALLGTGVLLLGVAAPAGALTPPIAPPALNGLPSVITGGTAVAGATTDQTMMAVMLYRMAKSSAFQNAVRARAAGTASSTQVAALTSEAESYTMPATKLATLGKAVGGATAALGSYELGAQLGHGILGLAGVNADGAVCGNTSGVGQAVVGFITGVNCDDYNSIPHGFVANTDVSPRPSGWTATTLYRGYVAPPGTSYFGCVLSAVTVVGSNASYTCKVIPGSQRQTLDSGVAFCRNTTTPTSFKQVNQTYSISPPVGESPANYAPGVTGDTFTMSVACGTGYAPYSMFTSSPGPGTDQAQADYPGSCAQPTGSPTPVRWYAATATCGPGRGLTPTPTGCFGVSSRTRAGRRHSRTRPDSGNPRACCLRCRVLRRRAG